jgi:hypothetical protein
MNKQFALIFAALSTSIIVIGIGSITSVTHAQMGEQEGNFMTNWRVLVPKLIGDRDFL